MIENIIHQESIYAIIIRANYEKEGISFFTSDDFSQQLGYMKRPKGYEIPPHVHNVVPREVTLTQEVLFIKRGIVRVDFYQQDKTYLFSKILNQGDVILLAAGGHGFTIIEEAEIIEVKQGPYCGELDKVRFESVNNSSEQIKLV
jgi:hypothetical protein